MASALATTFVIINTGGFKLIGVELSTYATGDTVDFDAAGASVATIFGFAAGTGKSQAATVLLGTFSSNRITISSAGSDNTMLVWGA